MGRAAPWAGFAAKARENSLYILRKAEPILPVSEAINRGRIEYKYMAVVALNLEKPDQSIKLV